MLDALAMTLMLRELQQTDDPAIRSALEIVGQQLNPVRVIGPDAIQKHYAGRDEVPSPDMVAFRMPQDPYIYVNSESKQYNKAKKNKAARVALAGSLVHEQIHNTDGEEAARRKEADFLESKMRDVPVNDRRNMQLRIMAMNTLAK